MNVLHFNFGNKVLDGNITSTEGVEWIWTHDGKWNYFETTIDGIKYNVYFADYYQAVEAGATTEQLVQGVYLDKTFFDIMTVCYAFGEEVTLMMAGLEQCPPEARQLAKAEGFDSASEASHCSSLVQIHNSWVALLTTGNKQATGFERAHTRPGGPQLLLLDSLSSPRKRGQVQSARYVNRTFSYEIKGGGKNETKNWIIVLALISITSMASSTMRLFYRGEDRACLMWTPHRRRSYSPGGTAADRRDPTPFPKEGVTVARYIHL